MSDSHATTFLPSSFIQIVTDACNFAFIKPRILCVTEQDTVCQLLAHGLLVWEIKAAIKSLVHCLAFDSI